MNLVWCINGNPSYVEMTNWSFESFLRFNDQISAYAIVDSETPLPRLDKRIKQICHPLKTIYRQRLNTTEGSRDRLQNSSYLKCFIPEVLHDLDKCLFVDADILCFKNIKEVYDLDVKFLMTFFSSQSHNTRIWLNELGLNHRKHWFHTGLMLMNLKALREDNFSKKIFNGMNTIKTSFWCHEETLLNYNYNSDPRIEELPKDFQTLEPLDSPMNSLGDLKQITGHLIHYWDKKRKPRMRDDFAKLDNVCKLRKIKEIAKKSSKQDFIDKKLKKIYMTDRAVARWLDANYTLTDNLNEAELVLIYKADEADILSIADEVIERNIPVLFIEDSLIRSVTAPNSQTLKKFKQPIGYQIIKDSLEQDIVDFDKVLTDADRSEGLEIIKTIVNNDLSSINNYPSIVFEEPFILIVDEPKLSVKELDDIIFDAIKENPGHKFLLKTGRRNIKSDKFRMLEGPCNTMALVKSALKVYVKSSYVGFEALMAGKPVKAFGNSFYSGLGLTEDVNLDFKRPLSIEELAYLVFSEMTKWPDSSGKLIKPVEALNNLIKLKGLLK